MSIHFFTESRKKQKNDLKWSKGGFLNLMLRNYTFSNDYFPISFRNIFKQRTESSSIYYIKTLKNINKWNKMIVK